MNRSKILLIILIAIFKHSTTEEQAENIANGEGAASDNPDETRRNNKWKAVAGPVEFIPVQKISYVPKKNDRKEKDNRQQGPVETENDSGQEFNPNRQNSPSNIQPSNPGNKEKIPMESKTDPLHGAFKPRQKKNQPKSDNTQPQLPVGKGEPQQLIQKIEEKNSNPPLKTEEKPHQQFTDNYAPLENKKTPLNIKKGIDKSRPKETDPSSNIPPPLLPPSPVPPFPSGHEALQPHMADTSGYHQPIVIEGPTPLKGQNYLGPPDPLLPVYPIQGNVLDPQLPLGYNPLNIPNPVSQYGYNYPDLPDIMTPFDYDQDNNYGVEPANYPLNPIQMNAPVMPTDGSFLGYPANQYKPHQIPSFGLGAPPYGYNEGSPFPMHNFKQTELGNIYDENTDLSYKLEFPQKNDFQSNGHFNLEMNRPQPEFVQFPHSEKKKNPKRQPKAKQHSQPKELQTHHTNTDTFEDEYLFDNTYIQGSIEQEDLHNNYPNPKAGQSNEEYDKNPSDTDKSSSDVKQMSGDVKQLEFKHDTSVEDSQGDELLSSVGKTQSSEEVDGALGLSVEKTNEEMDGEGGEENSSEEGNEDGRYMVEMKNGIVHAHAEAIGRLPGNKPVRAEALAVADKPGQVAHAEAFAISVSRLPKVLSESSCKLRRGLLKRLLSRDIIRRLRFALSTRRG